MKEQLTIPFEELVNEYGKAIFKYIFSLVKHKELAEDLYQEVLLSAYLAYSSIKEQGKYKSWLYTIAINKCRDYWRKENKSKQFWKEEVYSYSVSFESPFIPEEEVLHNFSAQQMAEKVNLLPEIYRNPIYLYYYHDMSLVEIAQTNNLPMSTVKTRMKRAKERLRPKMLSLA
ncbi:RNA polymerase sigma factor (sigma-70 family) [Bacillus sp. SORGH_AS 510]|uniref:RNA polymerase sigma factor n=1 Tax=Bacillus sp. SORGH_AS_0510 TaxID=3041771 RepID=UPI00278842CD|nr:sigma-70 family RNA polymerase sigma factor [Bacillus sp. SORGH_AS_0510]MDQ1147442.1 RNA polymerase sigma factor (sigma-70 family) [Bacillus sp. SORGH_AS_0510]